MALRSAAKNHGWLFFVLLLGAWVCPPRSLAQAPSPGVLAQAQPKVRIQAIKITGNSAISTQELEAVARPYVGKDLDLGELRKVADLITEEYRQRGYTLARAIVPEQDIKEGAVEIIVLEGKVGEIKIQGNRWFSDSYIKGAFRRVERDKAVKQTSLEKTLLLLNDDPDIRASAALQAGAEAGTTDIVVTIEDKFPIHLSFDYNNNGVPSTSRHIFGNQLDVTDPWWGTHLTVRSTPGIDPVVTHFERYLFTIPLNNYGTKFGGSFSTGDFAVGGDLASAGLTGSSQSWGLFITHPFVRTRAYGLVGEFGFDLKDSKLFAKNELLNLDRIRLLKAGLNFDMADSTGRSIASIYVFQGLGAVFGASRNDNPSSSRVGGNRHQAADNRFTYATINFARYQRIFSFLNAVIRTSGLLTSQPLVSSEQFGLGGADSVRGYPAKEVVGDEGFNASAELRILPIPENEIVQLVFFVDYGLIQQRNATVPSQERFQSLLGYGPGLRLSLPYNFNFRFDVGFPWDPARNSVREFPVYYFQASVRF